MGFFVAYLYEFNGVRPMVAIDLEYKANKKDVKKDNKTLKESKNIMKKCELSIKTTFDS